MPSTQCLEVPERDGAGRRRSGSSILFSGIASAARSLSRNRAHLEGSPNEDRHPSRKSSHHSDLLINISENSSAASSYLLQVEHKGSGDAAPYAWDLIDLMPEDSDSPHPRHRCESPQGITKHVPSHIATSTNQEVEQVREESLLDNDDPFVMHRLRQLGYSTRSGGRQSGIIGGNIPGRPSLSACDECTEFGDGRVYCNVCNETYCDNCWDKNRQHRNNQHTADGVPHEKTDHVVAQKIKTCLKPCEDETQPQLHEEDAFTTWFGVIRNHANELLLEDFGRYASILAEGSASSREEPRYPGLVSFVGQTGAGKSTVIKMLIELQNRSRRHYESPVVGSVNESAPTSGDVHLYKDPKSFATKYPILYADCEGLQGGEREPLGARTRQKDKMVEPRRTDSLEKRMRRAHHSSKREILWAKDVEKKTREYAVKHLYPRLLFTFSDVIVFVLKNARSIEGTVELLVQWAAAALEMSSNQPVLPHLIIVMNASESSIDPVQWDVEHATNVHTDIPMDAIRANPALEPYVKYWEERRKPIRSTLDLLRSYYTSVRVIRIPTGARPNTMNQQLDKLYAEISAACEASRKRKRQLRMLLNADDLQPYLHFAFDHFTTKLTAPFDFVKASLKNNSIPNDFGGSILRLAINMMQAWQDQLDAQHIFNELSVMVASCIMLDSERKKRLGKAEHIFQHYMGFCDDALDDFYYDHWPCEFVSGRGRCVNVWVGHLKGHQSSDGKVISIGRYQSSFTPLTFRNRWRSMIFRNLDSLLRKNIRAEDNRSDEQRNRAAFRLHRRQVLRPFFAHVASHPSIDTSGASHSPVQPNGYLRDAVWSNDRPALCRPEFINHSTCYSCLMGPPEHPLRCGHVICTPCLQSHGTPNGKSIITVNKCPFQHEKGNWLEWAVPIKPPSAGIRILTLDGGGVRGIAELETLRLLENALGGIRVQEFFDLIVGTSAGGLIALSLGVENWSVEKCTQIFEDLCGGAFTRRKGVNIWGLGYLVRAHFSGIYATGPLEKALSSAFKDEKLFGGRRDGSSSHHAAKVALTSTSAAGMKPIVLANYNRVAHENSARTYAFQRPEKPDSEMYIWEAARATSAAPTYYRSFIHERTKQEYLDGGLFHNNPIKIADSERKLIWPEHADKEVDIIISVGSGYCPYTRLEHIPPTGPRLNAVQNLKALKRIAVGHIESSLDAENSWREYIRVRSPDRKSEFRFQRLNVILATQPPKLDDVGSMPELKKNVRENLLQGSRIKQIAQHLIATTFFFEQKLNSFSKLDSGFVKCTGTIHCRFPPRSDQVKGLGKFLRDDFIRQGHPPCFVVEETSHESEAIQVSISKEVMEEMCRDGVFTGMQIKPELQSEVAEFTIRLCLGDNDSNPRDSSSTLGSRQGNSLGYPISGFPRKLESPRTIRTATYTNFASHKRPPGSHRRRGEDHWNPSMIEPSFDSDSDPIARFSAPDWCVGGASAESLSTIRERLMMPSAELPHQRLIHEMPDTACGPTEIADTSVESWDALELA